MKRQMNIASSQTQNNASAYINLKALNAETGVMFGVHNFGIALHEDKQANAMSKFLVGKFHDAGFKATGESDVHKLDPDTAVIYQEAGNKAVNEVMLKLINGGGLKLEFNIFTKHPDYTVFAKPEADTDAYEAMLV